MNNYPIPPSSRNQLNWNRFTKQESGNWCLVIPSFYAELFTYQETELMEKASSNWRDTKTGEMKFIFFDNLENVEIGKINLFIDEYSKFVIIGKNNNIDKYFTNELDFCCALDYNFIRSGSEFERTEIGELEYQAKYNKCRKSRKTLVEFMVTALNRINRGFEIRKRCISYIPSTSDKIFHLPEKIAKEIAKSKNFSSYKDITIINSKINIRTLASKDLTFAEKIKKWKIIISNSHISLDKDVAGLDIYVIDDLYQSGVTMWSYAKYLKSIGANSVAGLVCVKTIGDKDNI